MECQFEMSFFKDCFFNFTLYQQYFTLNFTLILFQTFIFSKKKKQIEILIFSQNKKKRFKIDFYFTQITFFHIKNTKINKNSNKNSNKKCKIEFDMI